MRSVAVMQPYFLPYLGYFALLGRVDVFVSLDSVQYVRRGWISRNRIPTPEGDGWRYVGVPVRAAPRCTPIEAIEISKDDLWKSKLRKTLEHQYARAPYFDICMRLLEPIWQTSNLIRDLNESLLRRFGNYLSLTPTWLRASSLIHEHMELRELRGPDLIVGICRRLDAEAYWNLPGGAGFYDSEDFSRIGCKLRFLPSVDLSTKGDRFPGASNLSILDLAMRMPPGKIIRLAAESY